MTDSIGENASHSLRKLTNRKPAAASEIADAVSVLEALNTELHTAADACKQESDLEKAVAVALSESNATVQSLEHGIIDAKMRVVSALEEKDSVARDLSRAKKQLSLLPIAEPVEGSTESESAKCVGAEESCPAEPLSPSASLNGDPGATAVQLERTISQQTEADEAKAAALEEETRLEMTRLKELDSEIVSVTDRVDTARKRRQLLSEKLSSAYNEF